jgi:hypothetical protein
MDMDKNELKAVINGVAKNMVAKTYDSDLQADIMHAATLLGDFDVEGTVVDGNFTAVVIGNHTGRSFLGVSKRNPKDVPNRIRGIRLAASRAVRSGIEAMMGSSQ